MPKVNEVVNDTFNTAAAVATEFDMDATDDESLKVVLITAEMEQNTTPKSKQRSILIDCCSYEQSIPCRFGGQ